MAAELSPDDCIAIATAAGWHVEPEDDYDGGDVFRASPIGAAVGYGPWRPARELQPGDVYQWRREDGAEAAPGLWVIVNDDPFDDDVQARVATLVAH